jgi:hypothetical protein
LAGVAILGVSLVPLRAEEECASRV